MIGGAELLGLVCSLIFAIAVWWAFKPEKPPAISKEPTRSIRSRRSLAYPEDAWTTGYSDMLWAVYQMMFKKPLRADYNLRVMTFDNPVEKFAELMSTSDYLLKKYLDFDIESGRTSVQYLSSRNSDEFAQYILGGRNLIDDFDDALLRIKEDNELAKARMEGLKESDRHYINMRKSIGIVRDKDQKIISEHEEFDKKMKGVEDGQH